MGKARILVVDDSAASRDMLAAIYRAAGFADVKLAVDGPACLAAVEECPPDLVVLDLVMPGMDGYAVCRALRTRADLADVPILVQSALIDPADRTAAFQAGASDVVSKPHDPREILARTRVHLEHRAILKELEVFRADMERELALTGLLFRRLFPAPEAVAAIFPGLAWAAADLGDGFGGDLWGLVPLEDGSMTLHVVDIRSEGAEAAMNAFNVRAALERLATPEIASANLVAQATAAVDIPGHPLPWNGLLHLRSSPGWIDVAASGWAGFYRCGPTGTLEPLELREQPSGGIGTIGCPVLLTTAATLAAAGETGDFGRRLVADPAGFPAWLVARARAAGRNAAVALVIGCDR